MSTKKYKSGSAIDAEIAKLIEAKQKMIEGKVIAFEKNLLNKDLKAKLVDLEDSDIKELAKTIRVNFDKLLELSRKKEKAVRAKQAETAKVPVAPSEVPAHSSQPGMASQGMVYNEAPVQNGQVTA